MVPTVTNGKVYAGTTNSVAVFGLLNQPRPASTEIKTFAKAGSTATLTIDSTTNFNYQLQHTDSLTNAFSNIGSPQNGTTGITLTFTDPNASASVGFYRIVIGP